MPETTTDVNQAADRLNAGRPVAFPTETVYGLGADACNDGAVSQVFSLKGRPTGHPMIIHLLEPSQMADWAEDVPASARRLADELMPGPLTLVLRRRGGRGDAASGGHPTVALRVPEHPIARQLLGKVKSKALVAPSANRFGRPSPTEAGHVADDFADADLLILDGGRTTLGIESTVVGLTEPKSPQLLRAGAYTLNRIEDGLGVAILSGEPGIAAPGNLDSHYSPKQRLVVLGKDDFMNCVASMPQERVAAMGFKKPGGIEDGLWQQMSSDHRLAEKNLYRQLRLLEKTKATVIAVNKVPLKTDWHAVADRLMRATGIPSGSE